ncbi:MAG: putative amidoligase domain-containing protein [Fusobacteriaceae bacterium]
MDKIITLGTDPEMFTLDSQGRISSVAGKLGCDKWNQKDLGNGIFLQEDNVLVEFATVPSDSFKHFNDIIKLGIDVCDKEVNKVGHAVIPNVSSHSFTMDELNAFHKSVWEFGCEPDYNALTGMMNAKPKADDVGLRTAGGHVHFGYSDALQSMDLEESQCIMGVMCDYFLGIPALLMDPDDRRRELYGKAGAIRRKSYGIEYRTLSNFWIFNDVNRQFIWDQGHKAFEQLSGGFERLVSLVDPMEIQRVINENDKKSAEKYVKLLAVA